RAPPPPRSLHAALPISGLASFHQLLATPGRAGRQDRPTVRPVRVGGGAPRGLGSLHVRRGWDVLRLRHALRSPHVLRLRHLITHAFASARISPAPPSSRVAARAAPRTMGTEPSPEATSAGAAEP